MSEFVIPDKCADCPNQCYIAEKLAELKIIRTLTNDFAETLVGDDGVEFDKEVREVIADEEAARLAASTMRQEIGNALEFDEKLEVDLIKSSGNISASCDGPLKMRAPKNGKSYTVTLCTSPRINAHNIDNHIHTQVHLTVDPA